MEVGSSRNGDGGYSSGNSCYWRQMVEQKYNYLGLLLDRGSRNRIGGGSFKGGVVRPKNGNWKSALMCKQKKKKLRGCSIKIKHQGFFWGVAKSSWGVASKEIGLLIKKTNIKIRLGV